MALACRIGLCSAGAGCANVYTTPPALAPIGALRDAYIAWRDRDLARLNLLAPQLQSHLLAPYVESWQTLLAPEDRPIQRVLERHRGTQLAERLCAD